MSFGGMNYSNKKAEKHIQICKQIQKVASDLFESPAVYFSKHPQWEYQKLEEGNFFGISLFTTEKPMKPSFAKRPDVIVADKRAILLYVIEVKWGWITDVVESPFGRIRRPESDLQELFDHDELKNTKNAISRGKSCRIAVLDKNFRITEETEFLLISDFYELMNGYPRYESIMKSLDALLPDLIYLDYQRTHDSPFGVIQSFRDYVLFTKSPR